ncbi:MAG: hypothetical protein ACHQWU_12410 [Gemmatimonadales bacterium]
MTDSLRHSLATLSFFGTIVLLAACAETRPFERPVAKVQTLEARLEVSDSLPPAGSIVVVDVRLTGVGSERVGSVTDQIAYDTTGLRFVDEVALDDGGMRVSNPAVPGLVRAAGVRTQGFGASPVGSYRFEVRSPAALWRMKLTVTEMHETTTADASKRASVGATRAVHTP